MHKLTVGFPLIGGTEWNAGIVLLESLFFSLKRRFEDQICICALLSSSSKTVPQDLKTLIDRVEYMAVAGPKKITERIVRRVTRSNVLSDIALRLSAIDALAFTQSTHYRYIPTLDFLGDFQHKYLPGMFTSEECKQREEEFRNMAVFSSRVLLLSRAVCDDFKDFVPQYASKARVLSITSRIPERIFCEDPRSIASFYRLPDKYILFPSQIWRHKDHETAFAALQTLKAQGERVVLVCTGHCHDYRNPMHFSQLLQKLSASGIRDQVIFLGLLPREIVLILMRRSVGVLTTSLFEGYGLAVSEASSLGKTVILSDIAAHREHNLKSAIFFRPGDSEDLASKLYGIWRVGSPGPDAERELQGKLLLNEKLNVYADSFVAVLKEITNVSLTPVDLA